MKIGSVVSHFNKRVKLGVAIICPLASQKFCSPGTEASVSPPASLPEFILMIVLGLKVTSQGDQE